MLTSEGSGGRVEKGEVVLLRDVRLAEWCVGVKSFGKETQAEPANMSRGQSVIMC